MDLKVNSKIFYPSHGAGKVRAQKEIEFQGEKKQYFEFEFINNPLTVSTPIDNIDSLNIRAVFKPTEIKKKVSVLKKVKTKKPITDDFNTLSNTLKDLEGKGEIEAYVEIIQYCNFIKNEREKDGRLVPSSIERHFKNAIEQIAGELALSADIEFGKAEMDIQSIMGIKNAI